jgi:hypothetical protein
MGPETQRPVLAPTEPDMLTRLDQATCLDPLRRALAGLPPGWTVIPDCVLPPTRLGQKPARLPAVLLHPDFGIVLLEFEPQATADAVRRFRLRLGRAVDSAEREAIPVLHLRLSPDRSDRLGRALEHALAQRQAAGRVSGGFWMQPVLDVLLDIAPPAAMRLPLRSRAEDVARRPVGPAAWSGTMATAWAGTLACAGVGFIALLVFGGGAEDGRIPPPIARERTTEAARPAVASLPGPAGEHDLMLVAAGPRRDAILKDDTSGAQPAPPGSGQFAAPGPGAEPPRTAALPMPPRVIAPDPLAIHPVAAVAPPEPDPLAGSEPASAPAEASADAPVPAAGVPPLPEPDDLAGPEPWALATRPELPAAPLPEPEAIAAPEPWATGADAPASAAAEAEQTEVPAALVQAPLPEPEALAGAEPWTLPSGPETPAAVVQAPLPEPDALAGAEPWAAATRAEPPVPEADSLRAPEPWAFGADALPPAADAAGPAEAPAAVVQAPLPEADAYAGPEPWTAPVPSGPAAAVAGTPVPEGEAARESPPVADAPHATQAMSLPPPPVVPPRPPAAAPATGLAMVAPPRPAAPPPAVQMAPAMVAALIRRGDQMLAIGDISAARLLYERAAAAGSGAAALALGRTHDPAVMAQLGARGLRPDPEAAAGWYRRALALGEREAEPLLRALAEGGR